MLQLLGECKLMLMEPLAALHHFEAYLRVCPGDAVCHADHHVAANNDRSQNPRVWYCIGLVYDMCGSFSTAEAFYTRALEAEAGGGPLVAQLLYRLSVSCKRQDKLAESLQVHIHDAPSDNCS